MISCRFALFLIILSLHGAHAQTDTQPASRGVIRLVQFHQKNHPQLKVQDVYKLFYEAAFGPGHILDDSSAAVAGLMNELLSDDSISPGEPLLEPISPYDDLVRVNLRPFKALNLDAVMLVKVMFQSARETIPDTLMFDRMWNEFSALVEYGLLRFPADEMKAWDAKVQSGVRKAVHHSPEYSGADRPSYRVVRRNVFEATFGKSGQ